MKALDLFCGAGGASMGLARAGYEVTGVDLAPQPHYPFTFLQADALTVSLDGYDLIWASPPCQAYTWSTRRGREQQFPELIEPIRKRLIAARTPYVIENVVGAPLLAPVLLCGTMFGLGVLRHRLFETSFPAVALACRHQGTVSGGQYVTVAGHGGNGRRALHLWQAAMDIPWMTGPELTQAIPPAYSEYLARQCHQPIQPRLV